MVLLSASNNLACSRAFRAFFVFRLNPQKGSIKTSLYTAVPKIKQTKPINCSQMKCSLWHSSIKGNKKNTQTTMVLMVSTTALEAEDAYLDTDTPTKLKTEMLKMYNITKNSNNPLFPICWKAKYVFSTLQTP